VSPEEIPTPSPDDRFSFGLWTVGHPGHDPFGAPTRAPIPPWEIVRRLADLGAHGVSFHDNDLVPLHSSSQERDEIVARFRRALEETGMVVSMATTNLFHHPAFKDGAFTANDPEIRRLALAKSMHAIDLGAELGAPIYVFWGGREGVEAAASKSPVDALERYREAIDFLCGYVKDRHYGMRFALEPKPNEPRGDTFLPTVGHMLAFIAGLDDPEMVGVNPEVAHETMVGLSFHHAVAQALWANKLFHIDLNAQRIGRFDQDFRFGSEDVKEAFFVVKLLEGHGYDGPKHFDARPYRVETGEGVWDFARGCMQTYLILREKARRFLQDDEIAKALEEARVPDLGLSTVDGYSTEEAERLKASDFDLDVLGGRGCNNDRLDQLVMELVLGVR
jgi:xylose isomerase